MTIVALGLGSNLGNREHLIRGAVHQLALRVGRLVAVSTLYETEPWGVVDQPRFLNAAVLVDTCLCPFRLLIMTQSIEASMGRVRLERFGPRTVDIDILLYGSVVVTTPRLTIPHPGMISRASVLLPLADISPRAIHPLTGRTVADHLAALEIANAAAPYPPGLA